MIHYVDSSVLIEVYLQQPRAQMARRALALDAHRFSSLLLAIEIPVVLRRTLKDSGAALEVFDEDMRAIHLVNRFNEVAARVRADERLSRARSLDAFHLATAMQLRDDLDDPVHVLTMDERMRSVAIDVGLPLVDV